MVESTNINKQRQTEHVEGNWASFIYLDMASIAAKLNKLQAKLMTKMVDSV